MYRSSNMTLLRLIFFVSFLTLTFTTQVVKSSNSRWAEEPALIPPHLRSHFRENSNLTPLSEDELETLLFLLDKVRPAPGPGPGTTGMGGGSIHERRNKRTGHIQPQPQYKKSTDWSNYFGIDKRSIPVTDMDNNIPPPTNHHLLNEQIQNEGTLTNNNNNKHDTGTGGSSLISQEHEHEHEHENHGHDGTNNISKDHDKKKEQTLKQFYKSMALATNMKKKKRSTTQQETTTTNDLETKMKNIGDELIWNALKLTGSHKDEKLTKEELNNLKLKLVQEIGAAYSIEKLRQLLKQTVGQ